MEILKQEIDILITEIFDDEYIQMHRLITIHNSEGTEVPEELLISISNKYNEYFSYIMFLIFYHIHNIVKDDISLIMNNDLITRIKSIEFDFNGTMITIDSMLENIEEGHTRAKYPFHVDNLEGISSNYIKILEIAGFYEILFNENRIIGRKLLKKIIKFAIVEDSVKTLGYNIDIIYDIFNFFNNKYNNYIIRLIHDYEFIYTNLEIIYKFIQYNKDLIINMKMNGIIGHSGGIPPEAMRFIATYTKNNTSVINLIYELIINRIEFVNNIINYIIKIQLSILPYNQHYIRVLLEIVTLPRYYEHLVQLIDLFETQYSQISQNKYMKYKQKYLKLKYILNRKVQNLRY